jgi:CxxC motif-containing protein
MSGENKKDMVCIACPLGCKMQIQTLVNGKTTFKISGNKCSRGEKYAIDELTNPTRMVTSTVIIKNGHLSRLPVRTSSAIPKDKIFECMKTLEEVEVEGPVKSGEVIIKNLLGLNIDIIATRSM